MTLGCMTGRLCQYWATRQMKAVVLAVVMYWKGCVDKVDALMPRGWEGFCPRVTAWQTMQRAAAT